MVNPPFGTLNFFIVLFPLLIIAGIAGLRGKSLGGYSFACTLLMLFLIFGDSTAQASMLAVFWAAEFGVVRLYLAARSRGRGEWVYRGALLLSVLPMVLSRSLNGWALLGVSYMTFRAVQMIIEIHDGLITKFTLFQFTSFLLFFPALSSGPVDRFRAFLRDLERRPGPGEYETLLRRGIFRLFQGMAYKFIAALLIHDCWLGAIPAEPTFISSIEYMYAYTLYLFFDFAGYSRMAVGTGNILGIQVAENFDMPFISTDMRDFWNRWHMSLSFWFRDFLYTRFVMKALRGKWFASKYTASYLGFLLTMGAMGLWHGVTPFYIIYGLYHGALLAASDFFDRKYEGYRNFRKSGPGQAVSVLVTFHFVCFGFLIFSGYNFRG